MNRSWRALWKRIKRVQGARARGYVRIVELHKSGYPHLHLALDCAFIHQAVLSGWWRQISGSPIVDIRRIKSAPQIARYLAKYLTKAHETLPSRRKWSQSRSFLPPVPPRQRPPDEPDWTWKWTKDLLSDLALGLLNAGYRFDGAAFVALDFEAPSQSPPRPATA